MMCTTIVNYRMRDVGELKEKTNKKTRTYLYLKPVFNDKITPERRAISAEIDL